MLWTPITCTPVADGERRVSSERRANSGALIKSLSLAQALCLSGARARYHPVGKQAAQVRFEITA